MKHAKRFLSLTLVCILLISMPVTVSAAPSAGDYVYKIINYYQYHQMEAAVDIECLLNALEEVDPAQADCWEQIIAHWDYVNTQMDESAGTLPDGLPEDDSLCIVVLGYALKNDGSMAKELIGRLEVALAAAQKYPNAYIACTGGGTAKRNKTVTEAGQMAKWLMEQGVAEERIIIENASYSTVSNAQYTCEIIRNDYPQIRHLAMVTSDYHLARGSLLFAAESLLAVCGSEDVPLDIVGHAGFETDHKPEAVTTQAMDLGNLVGISVEKAKKPTLSELSYITVEGDTVCEAGMELRFTITAHYTSGLTRNVTPGAKYSGFDMSKAGAQTVTVSYTENGKTEWATIDIEMIVPETEAPPATEVPVVIAETEPPITEPIVEEKPESPDLGIAPYLLITLVAALIVLLLLKLRSK